MADNNYDPRNSAPVPPQGSGYTQQPTQRVTYAAPVAPAPAPKSGRGRTFATAFIGAGLACALAFGGFAAYNGATGKSSTGSVVLGSSSNGDITASASDESTELAEQVADKALPSVVAIDVYTNTSSTGSMIGRSSGSSQNLQETSLGSGVIISSDGYILTNYHVVEGADALKVTADGQTYDATVVGTDETTDLAVIKVDATGLTAIEIGSSADLKQGQWVMTVGSPFGLEQSVATGIVSATSRTISVSDSDSSSGYSTGSGSSTVYTNMIQTDAAINPGNSGGALVDENGKLIGINAVIESYSGNYSGVGFAIPVDYAMNIAQQIIDGKAPTHAQLGITTISVTSELNQRYNLGSDSGAYVNSVSGAAESAGLQEGDIITKVDDTQVTSSTDLIAAVRSHNVGDTVTVTYLRNGQEQTAQVTLQSDEDTSSSLSEQLGTQYGYGWGNSGSSYDSGSASGSAA